MQIKLMQWIDYYVGIPLCFLLSILNRILSIFSVSSSKTPQKILFIELSEMGSAILAYSSIVHAQEKLGKANVYFLIFEKNRESVDLLSIIPHENVICISENPCLPFFSPASAF